MANYCLKIKVLTPVRNASPFQRNTRQPISNYPPKLAKLQGVKTLSHRSLSEPFEGSHHPEHMTELDERAPE